MSSTRNLLIKRILSQSRRHPGHGIYHVFGLIFSYRHCFFSSIRALWRVRNKCLIHHHIFYKRCLKLLIWALNRHKTQSPLLIKAKRSDRRFRHPAWRSYTCFALLMQLYLYATRHIQACLRCAQIASDSQAALTWRWLQSGLSPSNWPMLNPEVYQRIIDTNGKNLIKGMQLLMADMCQWQGYLNFEKSQQSAFKLGQDIATTPGKIIYQNLCFELLYYPCDTPKHPPILLVPSWVNKYYLFDLRPKHSFIAHAKQSMPVYVISWVNPNKDTQFTLSDYLTAIEEALQWVQRRYPDPVHLVGSCLGGVLASLYAAQQHKAHHLSRLSLFASIIDYRHPGDLRHFMRPPQRAHAEFLMAKCGIWEGYKMATAFNLLDPEQFVWPYWINHYWKGKALSALDGLHWSLDLTNTPKALYRFFMDCFSLNPIPTPFKREGIEFDISSIDIPVYLLGLTDDHIAPAQGVFDSAQCFKNATFVCAGGGHFTGITNSPKANKYGYQSNQTSNTTWAQWQKTAISHPGSWWLHWQDWCATTPKEIKAYDYQNLGSAPGEYVRRALADISN